MIDFDQKDSIFEKFRLNASVISVFPQTEDESIRLQINFEQVTD